MPKYVPPLLTRFKKNIRVLREVVLLSMRSLSGMLAVLFFIPLPNFGTRFYWETYFLLRFNGYFFDELNFADRGGYEVADRE
jgi:hypothetical protein